MTNEVATELRLLAEAANGIVGTGQVCSAGGNSTPPNGTVGGKKERVCPGLCVFVKKDEGQTFKLGTAKIEKFHVSQHNWHTATFVQENVNHVKNTQISPPTGMNPQSPEKQTNVVFVQTHLPVRNR